MQNPQLYVMSNIIRFVNLLEVAKAVNPQSLIIWASLSYFYGLNTDNPFSKCDRTDHQVSLYAAKKKAGEESLASLSSVYGLNIESPFSACNRTDYSSMEKTRHGLFAFTKDIT
ncbi:hypothetical protein PVK06_034105 [Gossypium arboreum]|uniref:NAD-dependent epimerase/dehydratase domain-containing protein n=1 Tax=Gossypium arboreum TaxID=29729 RepID=A0ABR0ND81_GOSAR|nr:hypothetical protein PVK06_034105 [Gossypium arboreum]